MAKGVPTTGDPHPMQRCLECGYDLRFIAGDACPECGTHLGDEALRQIREADPDVLRIASGIDRIWRLQRRVIRLFIAWVLLFLSAAGLGLLMESAPSKWEFEFTVVVLVGLIVGFWLFGTFWRLAFAQCPSCARPYGARDFISWQFTSRCMHCGLERPPLFNSVRRR